MNIVALLGVRNEAIYMPYCLAHLVAQGIQVVIIDNDSTDDTLAIAKQWLGKGVIGIEHYPYQGFYDWQGILNFKMDVASRYKAEWYIHHDADEIRQTADGVETLSQAIARIDDAGYNAIDFLEFVFIPTDKTQNYVGTNYVQTMKYAYYFQPNPLHRVNAWKSGYDVNITSTGGHRAEFEGRLLAEEKLILRHYPVLSWQQLADKYTKQRIYSQQEVEEKGWHGKRANFDLNQAWLPLPEQLIQPELVGWDIRQPRQSHPFLAGVWS